MTSRIMQTIQIILFFLALSLPLLDSLFDLDSTEPPKENRVLNTLPDFPQNLEDVFDYPENFEPFYDDHFGFRNLLIRQHADHTILGKIDIQAVTTIVQPHSHQSFFFELGGLAEPKFGPLCTRCSHRTQT